MAFSQLVSRGDSEDYLRQTDKTALHVVEGTYPSEVSFYKTASSQWPLKNIQVDGTCCLLTVCGNPVERLMEEKDGEWVAFCVPALPKGSFQKSLGGSIS